MWKNPLGLSPGGDFSDTLLTQMSRRIAIGLGALLVAFHFWLLASQAWGGELADLSLVIRWLVAGGLLLGLRGLRRQGAPMFWGRRAVALWLLAALLHGPALADRLSVNGAPAASDIAATLVPVATATVVSAGLFLLLALGLGPRRRRGVPSRSLQFFEPVFAGARSHDTRLLLAPRPPPAFQM